MQEYSFFCFFYTVTGRFAPVFELAYRWVDYKADVTTKKRTHRSSNVETCNYKAQEQRCFRAD